MKDLALVIVSVGEEFCEKYLAPLIDSVQKFLTVPHEIVVFTDTAKDLGPGVTKFPHEFLGSGKAEALNKYRTMLTGRQYLLDNFSNVFIIDADCLFCSSVGSEILSSGITATLHPWGGFGGWCFEANPKSSAYVDKTKAGPYFQNCFQGGETAAFIALAEFAVDAIDQDASWGFIAGTVDESYFNRYMVDHPPTKVLPATYAYVPGVVTGEAKIQHFNANSWQPPEARIVI